MVDRFRLGQITSSVGLKGEVKVYPYTDYLHRFNELKELYIENDRYRIETVRYTDSMAIIKFQGVDDRNQAELLKSKYLFVDKSEARELTEDEYYIVDLVGLQVIDEDEAVIGTLTDVIQNTSQDVYEIQTGEGKRFLLPAVGEFILNIDLEKRQMKTHLIEGLMES